MSRLPWEITTEMFLSEAEVAALLGHIRGQVAKSSPMQITSASVDQLVIEVLLFSGLRTSEFCALKIADTGVGTRKSVFHVRGPGANRRTIHVPERLSATVRAFVKHVRPSLLPASVQPADLDQPLLFNERRRPYERTGLYRRVRRILTEARLGERASVQLLRHTYGFLAYKRTGGNLLFVQRQLGHAHPMITSVYARLVEESYEAMAEQVYAPGRIAKPRARRAVKV